MDPSDADFLKWLKEHENWYEAQSTKWGRILGSCKVVSFMAALISIVVAAASTEVFFSGIGKWLIVGATILTAFSSELLAQFKVREMEELREDGNLEVAAILSYTRQKFSEFSNDRTKINKIKDDVRKRVETLERNQHHRHVAIEAKSHIRKAPTNS
jgi:cobalamin biosynthesis protein CobD/CbiB